MHTSYLMNYLSENKPHKCVFGIHDRNDPRLRVIRNRPLIIMSKTKAECANRSTMDTRLQLKQRKIYRHTI